MKQLVPKALVAVLLSTAAGVTTGWAQVTATPEHAAIMERKLLSANRVLAGIAREDFKEIAQQAQRLRLLSQEAGWNVLQTPEYLRLSKDFRSTTEQLEEAAERNNIDAVGLAFIKLSIGCIDCHRYARKELPRVGQRPLALPPADGLTR